MYHPEDPEDIINLREIFKTVLSHWYFPVIGLILGLTISMVVVLYQPEKLGSFSSHSVLYLPPSPPRTVDYLPVLAPQTSIETYREMALRNSLLNEIFYKGTALQLRTKLEVSPRPVSRTLHFKVTTNNPTEAYNILLDWIEAFQKVRTSEVYQEPYYPLKANPDQQPNKKSLVIVYSTVGLIIGMAGIYAKKVLA